MLQREILTETVILPDGYAELVREGRIWFNDGEDPWDNGLLFQAISHPGQGYRRRSSSYELDRTGQVMTYRVVDEEVVSAFD